MREKERERESLRSISFASSVPGSGAILPDFVFCDFLSFFERSLPRRRHVTGLSLSLSSLSDFLNYLSLSYKVNFLTFNIPFKGMCGIEAGNFLYCPLLHPLRKAEPAILH